MVPALRQPGLESSLVQLGVKLLPFRLEGLHRTGRNLYELPYNQLNPFSQTVAGIRMPKRSIKIIDDRQHVLSRPSTPCSQFVAFAIETTAGIFQSAA